MEEENRLRVEEDGVDVLVGARGGLGGGGHFEWSEEAGDEYLQLLHVLLLRLHHAEHEAEQDRDQFSNRDRATLLCSVSPPEIKIQSQQQVLLRREARLDRKVPNTPLTSSSFSCSQRGGILCNFPQSVSTVAWDYISCILLLNNRRRHLPA